MTFTFSSAYRSTASVFSSWAGTGAFTRACIHGGASPACAGNDKKGQTRTATTSVNRLRIISVAGRSRTRLQDHLFVIACPHQLKEIPQCWVVLLLNNHQIDVHFSIQVDGLFIVF